MYCYQCEQTAKGEACTKMGVCGKDSDVATLQDLLIYGLKGLALYALEGRKVGINQREVNVFTCEAIFSTLTNVNFDPDRFIRLIERLRQPERQPEGKGEGRRRKGRFPGWACCLCARERPCRD